MAPSRDDRASRRKGVLPRLGQSGYFANAGLSALEPGRISKKKAPSNRRHVFRKKDVTSNWDERLSAKTPLSQMSSASFRENTGRPARGAISRGFGARNGSRSRLTGGTRDVRLTEPSRADSARRTVGGHVSPETHVTHHLQSRRARFRRAERLAATSRRSNTVVATDGGRVRTVGTRASPPSQLRTSQVSSRAALMAWSSSSTFAGPHVPIIRFKR